MVFEVPSTTNCSMICVVVHCKRPGRWSGLKLIQTDTSMWFIKKLYEHLLPEQKDGVGEDSDKIQVEGNIFSKSFLLLISECFSAPGDRLIPPQTSDCAHTTASHYDT